MKTISYWRQVKIKQKVILCKIYASTVMLSWKYGHNEALDMQMITIFDENNSIQSHFTVDDLAW